MYYYSESKFEVDMVDILLYFLILKKSSFSVIILLKAHIKVLFYTRHILY